jgi:hypothetical protein
MHHLDQSLIFILSVLTQPARRSAKCSARGALQMLCLQQRQVIRQLPNDAAYPKAPMEDARRRLHERATYAR